MRIGLRDPCRKRETETDGKACEASAEVEYAREVFGIEVVAFATSVLVGG